MIKSSIARLMLLTAILIGCSQPSNNSISVFEKSDLDGLTIDLISTKKVEWMSFNLKGTVAVTSGSQGGPLCAPLFFWEIDEEGVLLIGEIDDEEFQRVEESGGRLDYRVKKIVYEFRKIELADTKLVAEVNGTKQSYKRSK